MYVICIIGSKFLEKDKKYKVINIDDDSYEIQGKGWFHKMNFEKLEDKRDKLVEKILSI